MTEKATEEDAWEAYQKEPRYTVGLQKPNDLCCYKDFHECNTLTEAKQMADIEAQETGRATIVFDRREFSIVYRVAAANQPQPEEKKVTHAKAVRRRGSARND